MPTSDEFVSLSLKRFLSQNRMSENFLEYNQEGRFDGLSRIFPESGLFTYPVSITPTITDFDLAPDPIEGIDNSGHVIIVTGNDRLSGVPFENTPGDYYWIGLHYIELPSGVYINPRSGIPEFDKIMEEVGELDDPSSVTDLVGTIRLNCNSIFEASIDHSGRTVVVGLKNPMSGDAAVAFETCLVVYDAGSGENRITTVGTLGQSTVSITAADYFVACLGCTVRKSVLNPFSDEYIVLGNILGHAVTPTAATGVQRDLSGGGGHTLQKAYDGLAGSGSGRNITANDQAVEITQENDTPSEHDVYNSKLRIVGDTDKALWSGAVTNADLEVGIDIKNRFFSYGGVINRINIGDYSGAGYLNNTETITIAGGSAVITFTRVGVDLTFPALATDLHPNAGIEIVEITGSAAGNDGAYLISAVASGTLTLTDISGVAVVLSAELATPGLSASVYRIVGRLGGAFGESYFFGLDDIKLDAGASGRADLAIYATSGSPDSAYLFEAGRYNAAFAALTDYVRMYANGNLAASNNITAGVNITATTGNITASIGDVVATAGDVVATAGNVIATAGNITATVGDVIAGDDITATAGDIVATAGYIEATVGDVKAGANFEYVAAKTFYMRYGPADALSRFNSTGATTEPYWELIIDGSLQHSLRATAQAGDARGECVIPLHLPDGCVLEEAYFILHSPSGVGLEASLGYHEHIHAWPTPTLDAAPVSLGTGTTGSTALQTVRITGLAHSVKNEDNCYFAKLKAINNDTDLFYELRLTCYVTEFKPTFA